MYQLYRYNRNFSSICRNARQSFSVKIASALIPAKKARSSYIDLWCWGLFVFFWFYDSYDSLQEKHLQEKHHFLEKFRFWSPIILRIACNCPSPVLFTICSYSFRRMTRGWTPSVVPYPWRKKVSTRNAWKRRTIKL